MSLASIELNATTNRSLESSIPLYFECESTAQGNYDVYRTEASKYTIYMHLISADGKTYAAKKLK